MQTIKLNEGFDSLRRILKSKQIHPKSKAYVLYETAKHINGLQNKLHRLWSENMYLRKMVMGHHKTASALGRIRTRTHIAIRINQDFNAVNGNKMIQSESERTTEHSNGHKGFEQSNKENEMEATDAVPALPDRESDQPLDLTVNNQ